MIDHETLKAIYADSAVASRVTLEGALKDERGERLNAIYAVLGGMSRHGSPFGSSLIRADGGVNAFYVTYKFGDYQIIIAQFEFGNREWPFETIDGFIDWLTRQDRCIIATAEILRNQVVINRGGAK